MSDHSERKSVSSRRSFIVGVTGALVAAPALTTTPFADDRVIPLGPPRQETIQNVRWRKKGALTCYGLIAFRFM